MSQKQEIIMQKEQNNPQFKFLFDNIVSGNTFLKGSYWLEHGI